jgi:hypothetical protein
MFKFHLHRQRSTCSSVSRALPPRVAVSFRLAAPEIPELRSPRPLCRCWQADRTPPTRGWSLQSNLLSSSSNCLRAPGLLIFLVIAAPLPGAQL